MSGDYRQIIERLEPKVASRRLQDVEAQQRWLGEEAARRAWESTPEGIAHVAAERKRLEETAWLKEAPILGVPPRLMKASFDCKDRWQTAALARAKRYVEDAEIDEGAALILAGNTGCGKSSAAAAILRLRGRQSRGRFWSFSDLATTLLLEARRGEDETLRAAKTVDLAVFDDFGMEYLKPDGLFWTFLDSIIWTREAHYKATVVTTNSTIDDLKTRYSDRIISRFLGDWGRVCEVPDRDLRQQRVEV
jgi:DNA replication protein DnaC